MSCVNDMEPFSRSLRHTYCNFRLRDETVDGTYRDAVSEQIGNELFGQGSGIGRMIIHRSCGNEGRLEFIH